jgi:hypothetical protein
LRLGPSGNISGVTAERHGGDRPGDPRDEPDPVESAGEPPEPDAVESPAEPPEPDATEPRREPDVVAEGVFYALFRVVEIDELSGPEKALEWARMVVEDAGYRRAFADNVRRAVASR